MGVGALTAQSTAGQSVRRLVMREGELYETGSGVPLKIDVHESGMWVGCTFVSWEAWHYIEQHASRGFGKKLGAALRRLRNK